jgi:hypothetical protein
LSQNAYLLFYEKVFEEEVKKAVNGIEVANGIKTKETKHE